MKKQILRSFLALLLCVALSLPGKSQDLMQRTYEPTLYNMLFHSTVHLAGSGNRYLLYFMMDTIGS